MRSCYLAAPKFEAQLAAELKGHITAQHDRLFISSEPPTPSLWALNVWKKPQIVTFKSINEAARLLKSIQRNWSLFPYKSIRRAQLIASKLPYISSKKLSFPTAIPTQPMGSWTLLGDHEMLLSPDCSSLFPNGELHFEEDKVNPPSRAYLKLMEALTLMGDHPKEGDRCLEIGAAPGSWTYVLANLGSHVIACDRAPLAPHIAQRTNVEYIQGDAFSLTPEKVGTIDWICSDIICYPDKLFEWVKKWVKSGQCSRFIITIKLQGEEDQQAIDRFCSLPNAYVTHLFHNKHELTFMLNKTHKDFI